ncbi:SICA antigen [Plasmodium coatneyi]|uniref:SICA antigen n=1 Tax=Plasmodium coatneyi TaxID=208452 RepID=A0A1B1DXP2_9APIC|nr:SICA antigen [Plasmodium coatneyi]ANQ07377.1 SICA antigen [Plasmodium coatneyi]
MWSDGDIGADLKKLSTAMTSVRKAVGDECQDFQGNGGTNGPANKKACELIVKGLEHIYKIPVDGKDSPKHQKDNQLFKRTMSCILLNALADKLLTAGTSCGITEVGIKKMFQRGNEKMDDWCKIGGEANCVKCERITNLKDCEIGEEGNKTNVKDKVKGMLDNDENNKPEIEQGLEEITNICQTTYSTNHQLDAQAAKPPRPTNEIDMVDTILPEAGGPATIELSTGTVKLPPEPDPKLLEGVTGGEEGPSVPLPQAPGGIKPQGPRKLTIEGIVPSDLLTPYIPTIPVFLGISAMTYLLWKYFGILRKTRKRYRRAYQIRGPILQEQIMDHADQPRPREYTLVKECKPRSTPKIRRKRESPGRRVNRRMIIDIHLEVLDECQKGDIHSTKEDFFEILVQEFMGSEFMKEKSVSEVNVPKEVVPKEQVQSSHSWFREEDFIPKENFISKEGVP